MKKTSVKTSATKASASSAKPLAAGKKKAITKQPKPAAVSATPAKIAKNPKAAKASKPVSVAPAVKPAKTSPDARAKPAMVTTTVVAAVDVGFGNHLTLRGEGSGLSWDVGVPLECVSDDRWTITLPESAHPIVCKFLINDVTWCTGEDYTVLPGSTVVLSPTF